MRSDRAVLSPTAEGLTHFIHDGSASREVPRRPVIAKAAEEDEPARRPELEDFERYVARRYSALLRTAYLLTGDSYAAEDLVQTALARAWLAWPRIREPAGVDTYVRRVLVNTQRSFWRRRRVQELLVGSVPERQSGIGATSDLHQVMWAALADLPRQQRATLVLRYYEGLANPEIAEVLGVSAGTVKSNASRALAALRQRASSPVSCTHTSVTGSLYCPGTLVEGV
jgi:RNA polymerase sigma-70 factor (sigma-E family)